MGNHMGYIKKGFFHLGATCALGFGLLALFPALSHADKDSNRAKSTELAQARDDLKGIREDIKKTKEEIATLERAKSGIEGGIEMDATDKDKVRTIIKDTNFSTEQCDACAQPCNAKIDLKFMGVNSSEEFVQAADTAGKTTCEFIGGRLQEKFEGITSASGRLSAACDSAIRFCGPIAIEFAKRKIDKRIEQLNLKITQKDTGYNSQAKDKEKEIKDIKEGCEYCELIEAIKPRPADFGDKMIYALQALTPTLQAGIGAYAYDRGVNAQASIYKSYYNGYYNSYNNYLTQCQTIGIPCQQPGLPGYGPGPLNGGYQNGFPGLYSSGIFQGGGGSFPGAYPGIMPYQSGFNLSAGFNAGGFTGLGNFSSPIISSPYNYGSLGALSNFGAYGAYGASQSSQMLDYQRQALVQQSGALIQQQQAEAAMRGASFLGGGGYNSFSSPYNYGLNNLSPYNGLFRPF